MSIDTLLRDSNNDGIPDAFENRPTITEILNSDAASSVAVENASTIKVAEGEKYRFSVVDGVVLLEVFGTLEVGACVFRSTAEMREFVDKLTVATQEAFPKPIKT